MKFARRNPLSPREAWERVVKDLFPVLDIGTEDGEFMVKEVTDLILPVMNTGVAPTHAEWHTLSYTRFVEISFFMTRMEQSSQTLSDVQSSLFVLQAQKRQRNKHFLVENRAAHADAVRIYKDLKQRFARVQSYT